MGHITLTFPKTRSNPTRKSQLLDFVSLIFFGIVILFVLLIFTPLGDSLAASSNQALIKSNLADPKQRGGLIALIESEKYGKVVDVCVNGDVDYMSCEDPTRNSMLSREMNFYRERQCPGVDERAVCLVPAPSGYWVPIQWHESLHKIHIQIKLISDVVPRAKMDIWWRLRRGGMFAKVKAAAKLACFGTPVVIASGITSNNIVKVLNGERVGTLFHKDAHMWIPVTEVDPHELAVSAREASRRLQALTSEERRKILLDVAAALEANEQFITLENDADIETAREAGYDESLVARLALKPSKIRALAESVRRLADMEEPIGHVLKRTELAEGLILEKKSCPLCVLLIVFESRPDALVQIASLAIRSGNGLLLKGGKEAKRSNAILHKVITSALPEAVGSKLIGLLTSREEIPELLKLDDVIDLVIPRGSNKLVSQIKNSTKIPVLGHSDGICHVYVDKAANLEMAKKIVLDAKTDYPAACNAMETLLVHKDLLASGGLQELVQELEEEGVTLFSGPKVNGAVNFSKANSLHHEYSSKACTIEIVNDVDEAIDHIHSYGSSHTECIVTDDHDVAEYFLSRVDSAAVFHNASTRFCDGARFGLGAEVGISTSKIHARGPVGVEGLLTTRWVLRGKGQVVEGDKGVVYTHKDLLMSNGY